MFCSLFKSGNFSWRIRIDQTNGSEVQIKGRKKEKSRIRRKAGVQAKGKDYSSCRGECEEEVRQMN